jgi:hypothetical protein
MLMPLISPSRHMRGIGTATGNTNSSGTAMSTPLRYVSTATTHRHQLSSYIAQCYLQIGPDPPDRDERLRLAEFAGRPLLTFRYPQRQPPIILKVYPEGHVGPRFVYILLTALLIERNRLWPAPEMK